MNLHAHILTARDTKAKRLRAKTALYLPSDLELSIREKLDLCIEAVVRLERLVEQIKLRERVRDSEK